MRHEKWGGIVSTISFATSFMNHFIRILFALSLRARALIRGHLLLWSSKSAVVTKSWITVAILSFESSRQTNKGNWVQGKMTMSSRLIITY